MSDQNGSVRLSINIGEDTQAQLRTYAERRGVSITVAVRRLVAFGSVVANADAEGKTVALHGKGKLPDGSYDVLHFPA